MSKKRKLDHEEIVENHDSDDEQEIGNDAGHPVSCPYLDTVDRKVLNFDFEKVCSVTLRNQNVYSCLVCGKYFHGKGPGTPAHVHSVMEHHFVFMNLQTAVIYCLPDDYHVDDKSLDDIKYNLRPTYTVQEVENNVESTATPRMDCSGTEYVPGYGPMNDLKNTDFINAIVQALAHIPPIRDFFLLASNYAKSPSKVTRFFGELVCKLWNHRKLKASISAHELMQAISVETDKKFQVGAQADAIEFLKWFLHELHKGVGGTHKPMSSIIHETFQGMVEVETEIVGSTSSSSSSSSSHHQPIPSKTTRVVPSLILSLDLPNSPLFKGEKEGFESLIPEVQLEEVLQKYKGEHGIDSVRQGNLERRRYRIVKLPPYIIFHVNRFSKADWGTEKNHTIVHLVVNNLDMSPYVAKSETPSRKQQEQDLSISKLKKLAKKHGIDIQNVVEKPELEKLVNQAIQKSKYYKPRSLHPVVEPKYKLIANICHHTFDSLDLKDRSKKSGHTDAVQEGSYLIHLYNSAKREWCEIQNLRVSETMPQLVSCSESYIAFYENIAKKNF